MDLAHHHRCSRVILDHFSRTSRHQNLISMATLILPITTIITAVARKQTLRGRRKEQYRTGDKDGSLVFEISKGLSTKEHEANAELAEVKAVIEGLSYCGGGGLEEDQDCL
ncbi:hypothetical protein Salat_0412300 [Sesamum alatum]|uniref:Uncharacterized protein n=1 Tax=Sesamum alatum TaxID=300844 RepID=A0AAE1Z252_9LAMI|nr:hypothetical protein Salat_0412300 [Sesamum alatum]